MRTFFPFFCLFFIAAVVLSSCKKNRSDVPDPTTPGTDIPNSFRYATTKDLSVSVQLLTNDNKPIKGAVLSVSDPSGSDKLFLKAVSDADGYVRGKITVPSYLDTLLISPNFVGLINNAKAYVGGKTSVSAILGGTFTASGDIVPNQIPPYTGDPGTILSLQNKKADVSARGLLTVTYGYPSPYTASSDAVVNSSTYPSSLGRPKYLENTPDVIDASLLNYVNASLPEGKPLTTTHPEYLTTNVGSNIVVTQTSDVWITFVSEGAGYLNSLGYYAYDTDNPPLSVTTGTSLGGIDKVTMVFPNASAYQSGGGLNSGDKVKVGRFEAGTTIAFVLLQNAWTGSGVSTSGTKFYSEAKFNPEIASTRKKHSVMLYDNVHNLFLFGFEDINREQSSDNDFNDLVVYATSNPVTGISTANVATIDKGGDTDGDGVLDALDDFPNDASKAYITYFPSQNGYSTLAFEDFWPQKGDYDLNDLVVNYRYTFISNASNAVTEMTGEYLPVAAGASFKNGFGVQLPVAASKVASVTGQVLQSNYIQLASNGVEAGQARAVIIPFDNHQNLLKNADGTDQVNTNPSKPKVTPTKATVLIKFASPVSAAEIGNAPFNPFLISSLRREYEIHLPDNVPTDKANKSILGTQDDASNQGTGKYYMNKENAPWAISFTDTFVYPIEGRAISDAYLRFLDWAKSGGTAYKDWYTNTGSGYRNTSNLYTK
ncbi:LruC domain-containing protein [Pedobacter sp. GR22-6]|uniref:LruC domain-containing protein n=1 Tax=Pedobacter sp. GR22-6 TaxID=3127957 RepID=UPI00307D85B1